MKVSPQIYANLCFDEEQFNHICEQRLNVPVKRVLQSVNDAFLNSRAEEFLLKMSRFVTKQKNF